MEKEADDMTNPSTSERIVKYSEEWWDSRSPEVRARRCHATNGKDEQCSKVAMEAQKVCGTHGGRAPQSKRAARRRIEEAQDRMAEELLGIATSAESEAVRLAAIKDALDRGGTTGKTSVEMEVGVRPFEQIFTGIDRGVGRDGTRAPQLPPQTALAPANPGEIVDAEIVPDPAESGPERHADAPEARRRAPGSPEAAEDKSAPRRPPPHKRPGNQLMTMEQANADLARDGVRPSSPRRRGRR